jgi:hypothetical protein
LDSVFGKPIIPEYGSRKGEDLVTLIHNVFTLPFGRGLRRRFSSENYAFLKFLAWLFDIYFPNRLCCWTTERKPRLRGFGGHNGASHLLKQIAGVNLLAATRMCRVMTWYGSDKGGYFHNYTVVYESLFKRLRTQPLQIFELGLGYNDLMVTSNTRTAGRPGASLRAWRDLFPNALIYGADIDRTVLFQEKNIKTFYCDQLNSDAIKELWGQPELSGGADIIIEDGLHTFDANVSFLRGSLDRVRPNGYYIIEDIEGTYTGDWLELLESTYAMQYPMYEFVLASLPHPKNKTDNNMLIIHRPSLGCQ